MKMMINCSAIVRERMEEMNASTSPMPIIGLYVAAASLACSVAMHFSTYLSLLSWLLKICNAGQIFRLNAAWLTLLAVATKLTGDLTTPMSPFDNLAKISSTIFLIVAMSHFFITLGSMNNRDILANLTALSILVITVVVNLYIQIRTRVIDFSVSSIIILPILLLPCMFIITVSSALAVPAIKIRAELKYQKLVSKIEGQPHTVEELRMSIAKHWVMAASSSPQSLMKRLVTYNLTKMIHVFSALISYLALKRTRHPLRWICLPQSDYKWSVKFILLSQMFAWGPRILTATLYLIGVVGCNKYEKSGIKISKQDFTIESYWTEKLVEWRQSSIPMRLKSRTLRKFLHNIKFVILTFCILLQTVTVMWCKFCCVISFYSLLPLVFLYKLVLQEELSDYERRIEADLKCFVILLDGEKQLPTRLFRQIFCWMDKEVQMGNEQHPLNLFNLLNKDFSFSGVVEFDSNQVLSLLSGEPPNCWTLPVVTLTSIAIALPNIPSNDVDKLVSSVDEGLRYARLIDVLDDKCKLKNIQNAGTVAWVEVELHKKWFDMNLKRKNGEVSSAREIIKALADVAKMTVIQFSSTEDEILVENPLYWPTNVLAANSMYRICQTILLYYENGECQAEEVFRKLNCMIVGILAACLTNLPHMIATKCNTAIEERLESVIGASFLFGETEDILMLFEERQLFGIGPSQPLCIDEWRKWIERQDPTISNSATNNGTPSVAESNEIMIV